MYKSFLFLIALLMVGCSGTPHDADTRVNESNYLKVDIGLAQGEDDEPFRFWGDRVPKNLAPANTDESHTFDQTKINQIKQQPFAPKVMGEQFNILVLSGGGPRGAFGAGVLLGLRDKGELPEYSMITGVSAGALIAPFVFVGGDKLDQLKEVMLGLDDESMLGGTSFFHFLFGDALSGGESFFQLVQQTYDDDFIKQIAAQYRAGKRLFIGTTHFDSGRQMIWNLGRIANSDLPNKKDLIHQILTASSSIPGVFPPQFIPVYYQGAQFEEMHVDGGLSSQLFFDPIGFDYTSFVKSLGYADAPRVYTIRNGRVKTEFEFVEDDTISLAARSVDNLIMAQTRGDIARELYITRKIGAEFYLTYIDDDFDKKPPQGKVFDKEYLQVLYEYGYNKAQQDGFWIEDLPL
ncbi:patatin-like phospholipase domain precursor [Vibrio ishigakensis]|uniref:Patatin-like phospholipase domain n=1 Tax=Vibrio ishigakensis TaxID=1481914 RepID=A0A0B8P1X9_9VIBR|nr:patatin-like phospholipase domain precursor [Vibrio ishigakensis]